METLSQVVSAISIHALLAESDMMPPSIACALCVFLSTLSLRRATRRGGIWRYLATRFLSTLSLRRATVEKVPADVFYQAFLSTLSLRRATCISSIINNVVNYFYPRSPCGERPPRVIREPATSRFLSTLSLRRATSMLTSLCCGCSDFYPRSPCGERRYLGARKSRDVCDFYPRSPCGERPNRA